jgi:hypothetical protein
MGGVLEFRATPPPLNTVAIMDMGLICSSPSVFATRFTDICFICCNTFFGAILTKLVRVKEFLALISRGGAYKRYRRWCSGKITAFRTTVAIWRRTGRGELRITTTLIISARRGMLRDILAIHGPYGVMGITTRQKTSETKDWPAYVVLHFYGFWDYTLKDPSAAAS